MSYYCSRCGKALDSGTRFCPSCGYEVAGPGNADSYSRSPYCSKCGKEIADGARFCPSCGSDTVGQGGGGYNQNNGPQYGSSSGQGMGGTLTIIFVLGILWILGSALFGLFCFIAEGAVLFYSGGLLIVAGVLCFACALFTLLSCINIYKLENYQQACMYCLIGSIIALFAAVIIVGVVGIIFYFLMKNEKNRFRS
ncbi:MAG: zinc ribbon domain-containing protein [Candidatus Methanoplasma sp.]|jgi:RNA polymerase subunit RPABC4/transcription elongation factor Spt4|nr:zinc ribbon domain-containing protein [Candidatus Methanoplasma sp.]